MRLVRSRVHVTATRVVSANTPVTPRNATQIWMRLGSFHSSERVYYLPVSALCLFDWTIYPASFIARIIIFYIQTRNSNRPISSSSSEKRKNHGYVRTITTINQHFLCTGPIPPVPVFLQLSLRADAILPFSNVVFILVEPVRHAATTTTTRV